MSWLEIVVEGLSCCPSNEGDHIPRSGSHVRPGATSFAGSTKESCRSRDGGSVLGTSGRIPISLHCAQSSMWNGFLSSWGKKELSS